MNAHQLTLKSNLLDLLRKAQYTVAVYQPQSVQSTRGQLEIAGIGWFRVGGQLFQEHLIERISVFPHDQFASINMGGVKPIPNQEV